MKTTISLVLVLVLGLAVEIANADFIFGTPTNLGPTVNSSGANSSPSISFDGLTLFYDSTRSGGSGDADVWIIRRETKHDDWGEPINLGSTINCPTVDGNPGISADGLSLFFDSDRPGGSGGRDIWLSTRETTNDPWGEPVNLGSTINSSSYDAQPSISADGLSLFFISERSGGYGGRDIWLTTRETTNEPWGEPVNLGSTVNCSVRDNSPSISTDGMSLIFESSRPGGSGSRDIWLTTRVTIYDPWGEPVNLGPMVNSSARDITPCISADGYTLYFCSNRSGGTGGYDLWQAPIEPVVDLNGDGIVNGADLSIIADYWGTDNSLCDIGPMPWGDGVVDVQDLIVMAEYLSPAKSEVNVNEADNDGQIELEQGQILVVTLQSNPTTGYSWQQAENQEPFLEKMGEPQFTQTPTDGPPVVGAGGWEIFRFKAVSVGQMTLQLGYRRSWEEGVDPILTFSIEVIVN